MTDSAKTEPDEVIAFWFDAGPEKWFKKTDAFDNAIRDRFAETIAAAGAGELDAWGETPRGALALVLLLDQFTRNINRGDAATWAFDGKAQALADDAVSRGFDMKLPPAERRWLYMPFMHAEDDKLQARSVELSARAENEEHAKYARHHADIVKMFGRFPHRNTALGRTSTPEEKEYLDEDGFKG